MVGGIGMSKRYLILLIVTISFTTSCAKEIPVNVEFKQENALPIEAVQEEVTEKQQSIEDKGLISREQAGLSTIPAKDISRLAINSRIDAILKGEKYLDIDYTSGIVHDWYGLILNERFTKDIIGGIGVGSDIAEVIDILGEPSSKEGDYIFYKTNKLYIAFKGVEKVETAIISNIPKKYDKDILKKLLSELTKEDSLDLYSLLHDNKEIGEFFDGNGHIHGGGWYADSNNGVAVEDFDGLSITVYNNFEGNLYNTQDLITYEDKDFMFEGLKIELDGYYWDNEQFAEEGILSPSGKYSSIYRWLTSDSHHFIIRTMNNSKSDFYIGVPALDYKWINDDYILYLNSYSTLPFAIKVTDNVHGRSSINIFYETGLIKSEDSTEGFDTNYLEIVSIEENEILIRDKNSDKQYLFRYEVDTDGKIEFTYLSN